MRVYEYFDSPCITENDAKYLDSRVQSNDFERCNDKFKEGKVLILVTTNAKKDKKIITLRKTIYICNSIDRVINLPSRNKLPAKLKENPGKRETC